MLQQQQETDTHVKLVLIYSFINSINIYWELLCASRTLFLALGIQFFKKDTKSTAPWSLHSNGYRQTINKTINNVSDDIIGQVSPMTEIDGSNDEREGQCYTRYLETFDKMTFETYTSRAKAFQAEEEQMQSPEAGTVIQNIAISLVA